VTLSLLSLILDGMLHLHTDTLVLGAVGFKETACRCRALQSLCCVAEGVHVLPVFAVCPSRHDEPSALHVRTGSCSICASILICPLVPCGCCLVHQA
jgi:hypothetical protein